MAPVGWLCMRRYAAHALEMILGAPAYFVREHTIPRRALMPPPADELWREQMPGTWLAIAGLTTILPLMLLGALFRASLTSTAASDALLITVVLGVGLQALCEGAVWRRYGHPALRGQSGIDANELMAERGYRWTEWWGWVRRG